MSKKLFIIGNGFDLHHGIPSSYWNFGEYVAVTNPDIYELVKEYLSFDEDFWNFFEERLATFDSDLVTEHASNYLVSYGADDWSDSDHHAYEFEVEKIVSGLSGQLRNLFAEWIRKLPNPNSLAVSKIRCVDANAAYLNFNYTPTLQNTYGISDKNILHIHGNSQQADSSLILGHGWEPQADERLASFVNEDTDTRVAGGYKLIDDYFSETFKQTDQIITQNKIFFQSLSNVTEVWVLGHSLAEVDAAYIFEIISQTPNTAFWTISYHDTSKSVQENFEKLGVPSNRVRYLPITML